LAEAKFTHPLNLADVNLAPILKVAELKKTHAPKAAWSK
jgi:hypothetical protein